MRLRTNSLGMPRIGANRELKKALEAYWKGQMSQTELAAVGQKLRLANWTLQRDKGIDLIPSGDFSFYDHVLDACCLFGIVPERFGWHDALVSLDTYFEMARGRSVPAMEMTKWFDTNYHYLVPELAESMSFRIGSDKPFDAFEEARAHGIVTKPVLVGPFTLLKCGKLKGGTPQDQVAIRSALLGRLVPLYQTVLERLGRMGVEWVQLDEPALCLDLSAAERGALSHAYKTLLATGNIPQVLLATYFGPLADNLSTVLDLPIQSLHIDAVRGKAELGAVLSGLKATTSLSLGLVDGRNIWQTDLTAATAVLARATATLGPDRVLVAPSCSLLHVPVSLRGETALEPGLRSWLACAEEKLDEVALLSRLALKADAKDTACLAANAASVAARACDPRLSVASVRQRSSAVTATDLVRHSKYRERVHTQRGALDLPSFPTTTIGSLPQTGEVRAARARSKSGMGTADSYDTFVADQIRAAITLQTELGLDVLVHGEFERNDMVEYFGEQLTGYAFTRNGWVQSYGSRCVKPPIIFGDVARPAAMTVRWSTYAQSLTSKPVKGMLTGPVTMLQWSFVRDDQSRAETCRQIALALRDEVLDLERAGISVIQIDEPALREGLPLRTSEHGSYLRWAVEAFLLATTGVTDATQIHTHMCYADFNDILEAVAALDTDVISIESSRSDDELARAFRDFSYPNEIGPGVYDIHSPRVPSTAEMQARLERMERVVPRERLWVNPDCGLKTRQWDEVVPALRNMVAAAHAMRRAQSPVS